MSEMNQSAARRALITGGANGFGLAIARAMLDAGAQVAIGDIDAQQLDRATKTLDNPRLLPFRLDVSDRQSVEAAVEACRAQFGGLDTLLNCAGIIHLSRLEDVSEDDWDRVINVDLKGVFFCSQAAAPLLRESGRGRIINIGSDASKVGFPMLHSYCAAKHGLVGLTKSLAGELALDKVTVNCICPVGAPSTGMGQDVLAWKVQATGQTPEEIMAATAADIPLQRNATEADVVNAVLFFLSDESDFLTGLALDVDGGLLSTIPLPGTD